MRQAHILRANMRNETAHSAVWFDTETKPKQFDLGTIEHKLNFGFMAHRRRLRNGKWSEAQWSRFSAVMDFWELLDGITRPRVKTYCFCHNTSFDLIVLDIFNSLPSLGWRLVTAIIEAPPTIIRFRKDSRTLVFLDTLNWWRMSLKELGKSIGLEKFDMPSMLHSKERWDQYAKRDVEIIMQACLNWFDFLIKNDLGGFAMTAAGQSFRSFRHRFMRADILIDSNERALAVSRGAFYGGRNECYQLGRIDGPIYYIDVNSMYPAVMRDNRFPTKISSYKRRINVNDIPAYCTNRLITAHVRLNTEEPAYPLRDKHKLTFPVGRFDTFLSTPEMLYASQRGVIEHVYEMAVYTGEPMFRDYVNYFHQSRLREHDSGNKVAAAMFKVLLVTLYGKFGQNGYKYEEEFWITDTAAKTWIEINADTGEVKKWRQFGGLVQCMSVASEARESHPAIAAHVTAYGRMMLWSLINKAGRDNVFYVDTDSLFVNSTGFYNLYDLIHSTALGFLKLEDVAPFVEVYGCKDYTFGAMQRHKGVKDKASWLTDNTVRQDQWSSLKGAIRNGAITAPMTRKVVKVLRRVYEKGTVDATGRVTPLLVNRPS